MKNRIRLPQLTAESCAVGWEHHLWVGKGYQPE